MRPPGRAVPFWAWRLVAGWAGSWTCLARAADQPRRRCTSVSFIGVSAALADAEQICESLQNAHFRAGICGGVVFSLLWCGGVSVDRLGLLPTTAQADGAHFVGAAASAGRSSRR